MYGSMSYMMITLGKGTAGFTLDPALGGQPARPRPPACSALPGGPLPGTQQPGCRLRAVYARVERGGGCARSVITPFLHLVPGGCRRVHHHAPLRQGKPLAVAGPHAPPRSGPALLPLIPGPPPLPVQVPHMGKIYSINEGNSTNWDVATKK